jgi:hypothetical protein
LLPALDVALMTEGVKGTAGEESPKGGTIGVLKSQHKRGARSRGVGVRLTNPRGALRQAEGTVDRVVHRERRMALRRGIRATAVGDSSGDAVDKDA